MTPEPARIDELVRRVVAELNGHASGNGHAPADGGALLRAGARASRQPLGPESWRAGDESPPSLRLEVRASRPLFREEAGGTPALRPEEKRRAGGTPALPAEEKSGTPALPAEEKSGTPALPAQEGTRPASTYQHHSRLIALADIEGRLDGHAALAVPPGTVLTPLALDYLRERGVRLELHAGRGEPARAAVWGYGQESASPTVETLIGSLQREGLSLRPAPGMGEGQQAIQAAAVEVCRGNCCGVVLFCDDAAVAACLANKLPGIRAAVGWTVERTARATVALGANVLAVEPAGRPFYELRQIVLTFCSAARLADDGRGCPRVACPETLGRVLGRWEANQP